MEKNEQAPAISKLTVEIHVVKIGKKQLSKSLFAQIPTMPLHEFREIFLDDDAEDENEIDSANQKNVWGWVKYTGLWVLFVHRGILQKTNLLIPDHRYPNSPTRIDPSLAFIKNCYPQIYL